MLMLPDIEIHIMFVRIMMRRFPFARHVQISGIGGAKRIAQELRDRGVKELDFVLDEGFFILDGFLDGIHQPVAVYYDDNFCIEIDRNPAPDLFKSMSHFQELHFHSVFHVFHVMTQDRCVPKGLCHLGDVCRRDARAFEPPAQEHVHRDVGRCLGPSRAESAAKLVRFRPGT